MAIAHPAPQPMPNTTPATFLAADVGGTHVRIGLASLDNGDRHVSLRSYRKYACADFADPGDIFSGFLADLDASPRIGTAVLATAGHLLDDGSLIAANLPWRLNPRTLRDRLGLAELHIVNDFEAVAHAAMDVDRRETLLLSGPDETIDGPILVLGPGTGLGAAVWIPSGNGGIVLATEAGQVALTPGNEIEMAVLTEMLRHRSHVAVESALSGPGLMHLHATLCTLHGRASAYRDPVEISRAAIAGSDPLARHSLHVFCGLLGSLVGDMALLYSAHGGVLLAGGILPQIRDFLTGSDFVARCLNKGPMRPALERIPIRLVEHGQLGVLGAARWLARKQRRAGVDAIR